MIAERDDISSGFDQLVVYLFCNTFAVSSIFAVDNSKIRRIFLLQCRQVGNNGFAAAAGDYITQKQDIH